MNVCICANNFHLNRSEIYHQYLNDPIFLLQSKGHNIPVLMQSEFSFACIFNWYQLVISFLFLILLKKIHISGNNLMGKAKNRIEIIFVDYITAFNRKNLFSLGLIGLLDTLCYALWSLWISNYLEFDLSFFQLLLLVSFIKLILLIKLTPGSIGINQFAASGIILLVGGTAAEGFTLSLYQSTIFIITSFMLGSIFFIVNMKYFFNNKPA